MPTPEPAAAPGSGKRKLLILIAVLGVAIYMAMAMAVDAHLLKEALQQLGLVGSGVVLALSLLNYLLRFVRWDVYLKRLGHSLPARRHLLYYTYWFRRYRQSRQGR
jgi:hypothetical protein